LEAQNFCQTALVENFYPIVPDKPSLPELPKSEETVCIERVLKSRAFIKGYAARLLSIRPDLLDKRKDIPGPSGEGNDTLNTAGEGKDIPGTPDKGKDKAG
jgi:hypothetical protein